MIKLLILNTVNIVIPKLNKQKSKNLSLHQLNLFFYSYHKINNVGKTKQMPKDIMRANTKDQYKVIVKSKRKVKMNDFAST